MKRYWFYVKNHFRNFYQIFTFWDPLSQKKRFSRKCQFVCPAPMDTIALDRIIRLSIKKGFCKNQKFHFPPKYTRYSNDIQKQNSLFKKNLQIFMWPFFYRRCFSSQFNRSIRDTNLFFNETQICCYLIKIMRRIFNCRKNFFLRFIGNFVFGVKIYFFNYSRELFFQLSITSSKIERF